MLQSSPSTFYDLAGGRRRGLRAAVLRGVLRLAEEPYRAAIAWRNRRYDHGAAEIFRPPVPVVSVGNLTVGGTGKTPLVKWIARRLREQDLRVAILSRGYKAADGGLNDEALELELDLPDVPHLQNPDRVASACVAVEELDMQVLLLDDGFQHRRLGRDLDIVLLDATEPFGFGHLLPRGTLREPLSALARADVIVLSRAEAIDEPTRRRIEEQSRRYAPQAAWCEVRHAPSAIVDASGARRPWQDLAGRPVAAFCGIGNPAAFRKTIESCGMEIVAWREFPDHYAYSRRDIEALADWCQRSSAEAALCTQKDLVKVQVERLGTLPLRAMCIEIEFLSNQDRCDRLLSSIGLQCRVDTASPEIRE